MRDDPTWYRWYAGFGDLRRKVATYEENLRSLRGLAFDYGIQDQFSWIPRVCEFFSLILRQAGIPHMAEGYPGGHSDQFAARFLRAALPYMSATMAP